MIQDRTDELNQIAQLSVRFFEEEGVHSKDASECLNELSALLDRGFQLLTRKDGKALVSFCIYQERAERVFLKRLYTAPDYRNHGYATNFVSELKRKGKPLSVYVAPQNEKAMRFYKNLDAREEFIALVL